MPPKAPAELAPNAEIEYLDALERELTEDVQREALLHAQRLAHGLARSGVRVDPDFAKHLAQDAISDTALGERRWDPHGARSLRTHLRGVIESRVFILRRHARGFPSSALADHDDEAMPLHDPAPHAAPERLTALRELAAQVLRPLYAAAADNHDDHVIGLLDAYADGVTKRAGAAAHAGISVAEYDSARKRLLVLLAALPESLRDDIAQTLRSKP